jgi:hypothetical protein
MTLFKTIIRYFSYDFSYNDTWDFNFFHSFSFMTDFFSYFFMLFSIMTGLGCRHPINRTVQTAILELCTEEGLISVDEEGPFTWINGKVHIQNKKQPDRAFPNYYTHYLYHYTHYFAWLAPGAGDGCRMWFINSWELGWSRDL